VLPFGGLLNQLNYFLTLSDTGRGGPMVEYERRIASGELVDGDSFQVLLWSLTKGSFIG